jgi:hypothetical protein
MRRNLLFLGLSLVVVSAHAQNVFNPKDPIVRYSSGSALGSSGKPRPTKTGLQKWVSISTNGISYGSGSWDASSFKAYFANLYGQGLAFRVKFPRSYSNPDSAGKKYPVMLFFHGAGEAGCSANGGVYNNEKQLLHGGQLFRDRVNNNLYDGFLVYPQLVPSDGTCWGTWGSSLSTNYKTAFAFLDSLNKYARADIDRVMVDGLSAGGQATWKVAEYFPQRVASIAPSSNAGMKQNFAVFIHIPIWLATGGKDTSPSPAMAQYSVNQVSNLGGNIKYTLYPDNGHSIWNKHWNEPGFVAYMNAAHKANPLVFFQQDKFCADANIAAHLGITQGFYAYEWQRNGVPIATKVNTTVTVNNSTYVQSFTGNEITVKALGTYRVRFRRTSSSGWSGFSPKPAVLGTKTSTNTAAITPAGYSSYVLPSLDGKTTVTLQLPPGYLKYEWYNAATNALVGTERLFVAGVGKYKAKYFEGYSCGSNFSPVFTVVNANGPNKPTASTGLSAISTSSSTVKLTWKDGSAETAVEVYRSLKPSGGYQFIRRLAANTVAFTDSNLQVDELYYYTVRAVNLTGAAPASNQAVVKVPGNPAPVLKGLRDVFVKTTATLNLPFTATDNSGDVVTVSLVESPSFVTIINSGSGNYTLRFRPGIDDIGRNTITVKAVDDKGNERFVQLRATIGDKDYRSVYVNLGNTLDKAGAPWNSWLGKLVAGKVISNLLDENGTNSGFSVTSSNAWMSINNLGFNTGENTGVYPDTVLKSGVSDTSAMKQFVFKGLARGNRYNLQFIASMNQGDTSPLILVSGAQTATVNARYNSRQNASLNGLIPDATGQIIVKIKKGSKGTMLYLNGIVIEEYSSAIAVNAPRNLTTEQIGNTAVQLFWTDRSLNESSSGGFELQQATDSLFTSHVVTRSLAGNSTTYRVTGLQPDMRFWFRIRAKAGTTYSGYSNRSSIQTPDALLNVNFNFTVANAPTGWNNLASNPVVPGTFSLKTSGSQATSIKLAIEKPFNGEFNAGKTTGNNSGIVPDNVLLADYWLDNTQISTMRLSGLNRQRQYNIGFIGSSGPAGWYKGNYTATYTINGRTVYLNSWQNTSKIVYINNVRPDVNGELLIEFSTTKDAAYGFNAGLIISQYSNLLVPAASALPSVANDHDAAEETTNENQKTRVYPNPFRDNLVIDYYNKKASDRVSTEVYDVNGRLVVSRQYNSLPVGSNRIMINSWGNANGVYIVTIRVNGEIAETHTVLRRTTR